MDGDLERQPSSRRRGSSGPRSGRAIRGGYPGAAPPDRTVWQLGLLFV